MSHLFLIAISGGPCAGKTSALPYAKKYLEKQGILTFTIQETATELMNSGATYNVCNGSIGFQSRVLELQLAKEELFIKIANKTKSAKQTAIILCDRGTVDCLAYLTSEERELFLNINNISYSQLLNRYDAVFHMTSVAKGNEKEYSSISNAVRLESSREAISVDQNLLDVWAKHNNCNIIDYEDEFTKKIMKLINGINSFLLANKTQLDDSMN